jgi:spoIIIJ-associated protein
VDAVEAEGRTVNEATSRALETLGLRLDQVEVEVLNQGRPRLLGFRGEPARVRVMPLPPPPPVAARITPQPQATGEADEDFEDELEDEDEEYDEDEEEYDEDEEYEEDEDEEEQVAAVISRPRPAAPPPEPVAVDPADVKVAVTALEEMIRLMSLDATVAARAPETAGDGIGLIEAVLDVEGDDLGALIGRRGQTLVSLQYLLNLIVSKQINRRVAFGIDVDGYRRRREDALVGLAKRTAARVRGTGRSVTLEPMPPNERRIVHLALADDPAVMTVSIGEGEARKVAITPTR